MQFRKYLIQGFASQITDLHHFFFGLVGQILYRIDIGSLQAVIRPDRQIQFLNGRFKSFAFAVFFFNDQSFSILSTIRQIDEQSQMVVQNFGSQRNRLIRPDRSVGPNFQGEFVVVRDLSYTSVLNLKVDPLNRRIQTVDGNNSDRLSGILILIGSDISSALGDRKIDRLFGIGSSA